MADGESKEQPKAEQEFLDSLDTPKLVELSKAVVGSPNKQTKDIENHLKALEKRKDTLIKDQTKAEELRANIVELTKVHLDLQRALADTSLAEKTKKEEKQKEDDQKKEEKKELVAPTYIGNDKYQGFTGFFKFLYDYADYGIDKGKEAWHGMSDNMKLVVGSLSGVTLLGGSYFASGPIGRFFSSIYHGVTGSPKPSGAPHGAPPQAQPQYPQQPYGPQPYAPYPQQPYPQAPNKPR